LKLQESIEKLVKLGTYDIDFKFVEYTTITK